MRLWVRLGEALKSLWLRFFGPRRYRATHVADAPEVLKDGVVYVVGADGYEWSALMRCPGGCGKTLEMNLLPTAKPVWRVSEDAKGVVTLRPSIWLKTGCKCHFIMKDGVVGWA